MFPERLLHSKVPPAVRLPLHLYLYLSPNIPTKAQRRLPVGELQPLPTPNDRWETMSVDFIVELPESGGYDAVMVIVDSASKRAHFCETTTTVTAASAANLYLRNVWKLHGLPRKVISDRGPQFVALFMKELFHLLGIEVASSTA